MDLLWLALSFWVQTCRDMLFLQMCFCHFWWWIVVYCCICFFGTKISESRGFISCLSRWRFIRICVFDLSAGGTVKSSVKWRRAWCSEGWRVLELSNIANFLWHQWCNWGSIGEGIEDLVWSCGCGCPSWISAPDPQWSHQWPGTSNFWDAIWCLLPLVALQNHSVLS